MAITTRFVMSSRAMPDMMMVCALRLVKAFCNTMKVETAIATSERSTRAISFTGENHALPMNQPAVANPVMRMYKLNLSMLPRQMFGMVQTVAAAKHSMVGPQVQIFRVGPMIALRMNPVIQKTDEATAMGLKIGSYFAPFPNKTAGMVFSRI